MNSSIVCEFDHFGADGIEALDFFKLNFDRLIDPNIISIKCSQYGIHVFRIDYKENNQTQGVKTPLGITTFFLDWREVFSEHGKYPLELEDLLSNVFYSGTSYDEKHKKLGLDLDDIFNDFEPHLVESLRLFGESDYFYKLYQADFEQNELSVKYDELELKYGELEDNYNEIAERYQSSIQFLLINSKEICSKPALTIFRRLEKKLKTNYQSSESVGSSSEEGIENRWDELGKWVYEESLREIARSDVNSDVESILDNLNEHEQQIILYDSLDESDLDFDVDKVIADISDISCFFDRDENFINPMVNNLLSEAEDDWRDKVWA